MLLKFFLFFQYILIPMDGVQTDHLKAYGIVYRCLQRGINFDWLLNYRGGSFIAEYSSEIEEECVNSSVFYELITNTVASNIYTYVEEHNMNALRLEVAPKLAVYAPPYTEPWDDAVELVLKYTNVPYDRIWDNEILEGKLEKYDWLHLHHEDFAGMYGKFEMAYGHTPWYIRMKETDNEVAKRYGFKNGPLMKQAVALKIKQYVENGGFLFSMCSGPITLDVALASVGIDIWDIPYDGTPFDPNANKKLNFKNTMAFHNFEIYMSYLNDEVSDIDVTREADIRGQNVCFKLFEFSAKYDPIPSLLTQNHVNCVREFLGRDTGFKRDKLKPYIIILGEVEKTEEVKYIYSSFGKGFFTFYGGHDPEDFKHFVGDPPTDLSKHKNSPGYRLILNNILFPAAQPQKLKT
ncbi:MAG: asparagine synthetase B [Candidatus Hydrothermales bacterium]